MTMLVRINNVHGNLYDRLVFVQWPYIRSLLVLKEHRIYMVLGNLFQLQTFINVSKETLVMDDGVLPIHYQCFGYKEFTSSLSSSTDRDLSVSSSLSARIERSFCFFSRFFSASTAAVRSTRRTSMMCFTMSNLS